MQNRVRTQPSIGVIASFGNRAHSEHQLFLCLPYNHPDNSAAVRQLRLYLEPAGPDRSTRLFDISSLE